MAEDSGAFHDAALIDGILPVVPGIVDRLHLSGAIEAGQLHVLLVPRNPVSTEAQISIGRISVFRQSN